MTEKQAERIIALLEQIYKRIGALLPGGEMSEARSEHEFDGIDGERYKVKWASILSWPGGAVAHAGWTLHRRSAAGNWIVRRASTNVLAAEIARLRGLVPPGGERGD